MFVFDLQTYTVGQFPIVIFLLMGVQIQLLKIRISLKGSASL